MIFPESEKEWTAARRAFAACEAGDFAAVRELVRANFNLEDCDEEGNSALHYAVRGGNLELIRFLVEQGGLDPTWANLRMETPFVLAKAYCPQACAYFEEWLGFSLAQSYQNPVQRGMHPDPSIVRVGEDYYMVNSSFIMFPCVPVSHSRDLVHWEVIGYAVTDAAWAQEHLGHIQGGRGFWAPDISYHNGRFYICATLRQNDDAPYIQTQMVTSAARPEGPYETPVIHNLLGIDPSIFTDDDGKRYMLINRGAQLLRISDDGRELLSEPQLIWYGSSKHAPEGPHLLKKDGWYYCFLAEGGTGMGHMITVARSRNLYGPYEDCPYNPIMRQKHSAGAIQCAGHGKPVSTPDGRWFMVYLCSRFLEGKWGMLGRETCLDEITWTPDGWPLVNHGRGPSTLAKLPFGAAQARGQDCVSQQAAREEWFSPRTMDRKYLRRLGDDGIIEIAGCGLDLCELGCRSLLLKNQPDFDFDCTFELLGSVEDGPETCAQGAGDARKEAEQGAPDVRKEAGQSAPDTEVSDLRSTLVMPDGGDTGVTLYYDENTYVKFGCTGSDVFVAEYYDDAYVREVRRPLSGVAAAEAVRPESTICVGAGREPQKSSAVFVGDSGSRAAASTVRALFRVETRGVLRRFFYNNELLAEWRVTGICSEGLVKGKRFTSAMYGVYVNGKGILRWRQHGDTQQD